MRINHQEEAKMNPTQHWRLRARPSTKYPIRIQGPS
ncbi:hypothetical protein MAR_030654 [Mya arenaria]|uniref:Uncharacterized protein n=1 Tax=Mya arenaria TaxID=6604 RepID=A0ABY7F413_MYAAR|nr:hypothetical protein MAR_030533 [Mya arenaria]WAR16060.1 hypothetical protein MAR_030654 [Mya arenaria]